MSPLIRVRRYIFGDSTKDDLQRQKKLEKEKRERRQKIQKKIETLEHFENVFWSKHRRRNVEGISNLVQRYPKMAKEFISNLYKEKRLYLFDDKLLVEGLTFDNKSMARHLASFISSKEDFLNFSLMPSFLKLLLQADRSLIGKFMPYIKKYMTSQFPGDLAKFMEVILKVDQDNAKTHAEKVASYITGDTIFQSKDTVSLIKILLENMSPKVAKKWANTWFKIILKNPVKVSHSTIKALLKFVDNPKAKAKAIVDWLIKNKGNKNIRGALIAVLLAVDSSLVKQLLQLVTQETISSQRGYIREIIEKLLKYSTRKDLVINHCLKLINKNNFNKIYYWVVYVLVEANKKLADLFIQYVDKDNILEIDSYLLTDIIKKVSTLPKDFIELIDQGVFLSISSDEIEAVLKKASSDTLAKKFVNYITPENIHHVSFSKIQVLVKFNADFAKIIAEKINTKNIQRLDRRTVMVLLKKGEQGVAQIIAKNITEDNIGLVESRIVDEFNQRSFITFSNKIIQKNIHKIPGETIEYVLDNDSSQAQRLAGYINQNNVSLIPAKTIDVLQSHDKNFEKKYIAMTLQVKDKRQRSLVTLFLNNPLALEHYLSMQRKMHRPQPKKTGTFFVSGQHFIPTVTHIVKMFGARLVGKKGFVATLSDILQHEKKESEKGRYMLYHSRNSGRFVNDQVFLRLLGLYYNKDLTQAMWYPQHWRKPGEYYPYDKFPKVVAKGTDADRDARQYMQFFSDLFGVRGGSSALDYALRNDNAPGLRGKKLPSIDDLFALFGWKKYAEIGKDKFNKAFEESKKFVYGTMLVYSCTPQALKLFFYATSAGGGEKRVVSMKDYKKDTSDVQTVLETLKNNPDAFATDIKNAEYVMILTNDHPDNKMMLGSAHPLNQDIRVAYFNFDKDKKVAETIKELIDKAFVDIKKGMIKDGHKIKEAVRKQKKVVKKAMIKDVYKVKEAVRKDKKFMSDDEFKKLPDLTSVRKSISTFRK